MGKFDNLKKVLYDFYKINKSKGRKYIRDHFLELGAPSRLLDRWLTSLDENKTLDRKFGSGRPRTIATKAKIAKVKKHFNNRSGCSQRKFAKKLNCHQTTIGKILKKYSQITCRKKQKKPLMTEKQKEAS